MKIEIRPKQQNRRRAIRARCLDCSAGSFAEVRDCEHGDCSLYPYRSGQGRQNPKERIQAIRAFCMWCMCDQWTEIRECPSIDCPLWSYRMGAKTQPLPKNGHIRLCFDAKILGEGYDKDPSEIVPENTYQGAV